jgi:serine/threonine protein kinase
MRDTLARFRVDASSVSSDGNARAAWRSNSYDKLNPDDLIDLHASSETAAYVQLESLQGKYIPKLLDFGYLEDISDDGFVRGPYLILQDMGNTKPDPESLQHFRAAALGLKKIHENKICHGDIAGRNMRVVNEEVFFFDFARCLEADERSDWLQLTSYFERSPKELNRVVGRKVLEVSL